MMVVSEANFDLRFEFSNLNYPGTCVHVVSDSRLGGLWGHDGLQMTSEVTSDLKIELSDLNYLFVHASPDCKGFPEMIDTMTTTGQ